MVQPSRMSLDPQMWQLTFRDRMIHLNSKCILEYQLLLSQDRNSKKSNELVDAQFLGK